MTPKNNWSTVTMASGRGRVVAAWTWMNGWRMEPLDVLVDVDRPYRHHEAVAAFTVQPA